MPATLTLDTVTITTPNGTPLLSDLTLLFGPGRHGLVGRNGCGKSTLLDVMAGCADPASGHVGTTGSVHLLRQSPGPATDAAALMGVAEDHARISRLLAGNGSVEDAGRADWTLPDRMEAALDRVGLPGTDPTRPVASFSGGEQMRLLLAGAMLSQADILLLDEPTNNMDGAGRAMVLSVLRDWPGPVIVASHDRTLLEEMDRIIDLDSPGAEVTGGGWSTFEANREARRARAARAMDRAEADLTRARRDRQKMRERQARKASKGQGARADGSMPKMWHDMQQARAEKTSGRGEDSHADRIAGAEAQKAQAEAALTRLTPLHLDLPATGLAPRKQVLRMEAVTITPGARRIGPVDLTLTGPERIAIDGPNGIGKTSLLRVIAGEEAALSGHFHNTAHTAWLDQDLRRLGQGGTLLDAMRRRLPDQTEAQIRAALARFAFRNREAEKPLQALSGGERLRAGLLAAFASDPAPDLLLLDEPTNHLDLRSIEELETTLNAFDGALIVISHDSAFLDRIGVRRRLILSESDESPHILAETRP